MVREWIFGLNKIDPRKDHVAWIVLFCIGGNNIYLTKSILKRI